MIQILLAGATILPVLEGEPLKLPPEGRWTIGLGWEEEWPAEWRHADATRTEQAGDWTIHHGSMDLPGGVLRLRDAERVRDDGLMEIRRRWEWEGAEPLEKVTLAIRRQWEAESTRPFLPGISYYDNPAGRAVDPTRIPVIGAAEGAMGFYEEHRYPMPLASAEGRTADGATAMVALHSLPSPMAFGNLEDQWWSLGFARPQTGTVELAVLSGAVASNGERGIIKARQRAFIPYAGAWSTLPPGAIVEKTVFLQGPVECRRGSGFRPAVRASLGLFDMVSTDGYTPYREILALKMKDSASRFREDEQFAGIDAFPGEERPWIDLGWAGQSEAVAYPFIVMGDSFGTSRAHEIARKSLDFISTSPFTGDGFSIRYNFKEHQWLDRRNPLSQGQTMNNMLNALRAAREKGGYATGKWEAFLRKACRLHADRILDPQWHPVSTNEGFLIAPLAQGAVLLGMPELAVAARKAADHYIGRHLSMDEPYWGGTLDARCEDKEGAWAALQGFLAMHDLTGETRYLEAAEHAADVVLSYMYVWDVALPPGRLADHGFRSRGWTAVSVQNMHLDVYGVLCAPAIWHLAGLTGRDELKGIARLLSVPAGQFTDPWGSAGEQIHQTHYAQHYDPDPGRLKGVRGDYIESWNVYWISAHFLTAAAQFAEMGVDCTQW